MKDLTKGMGGIASPTKTSGGSSIVGLGSPTPTKRKEGAWIYNPANACPLVWLLTGLGQYSVRLYFQHIWADRETWQMNNRDFAQA